MHQLHSWEKREEPEGCWCRCCAHLQSLCGSQALCCALSFLAHEWPQTAVVWPPILAASIVATSHHISPVSSHSLSVMCLSSLARARAGELSSSRESGCKQTTSSFLSSRHRRFLNPRECVSDPILNFLIFCRFNQVSMRAFDFASFTSWLRREPFERKTRSDTLPQRRTPVFFLFPTIGNPRAELAFLAFLQENQSLFVLSVVSATGLQMAMYSLRHCSQSVRSTNMCFISICFFFFFCCNSDEGDS